MKACAVLVLLSSSPVNEEKLEVTAWMDEEVYASALSDFFIRSLSTTQRAPRVLQQTICFNV